MVYYWTDIKFWYSQHPWGRCRQRHSPLPWSYGPRSPRSTSWCCSSSRCSCRTRMKNCSPEIVISKTILRWLYSITCIFTFLCKYLLPPIKDEPRGIFFSLLQPLVSRCNGMCLAQMSNYNYLGLRPLFIISEHCCWKNIFDSDENYFH